MRTRRTLTALLAAGAAAAALVLAGCASAADAPAASPTGGTGSSSSEVGGTITVFAAASLTSTFTELGKRFEQAHPGSTVTFSFAGSSDLVTQLSEGAPADVFASADETNMQKAQKAGVIDGDPVDFATNVLAIAVPPGNPARIGSFADLAKPGVKTVVCAPQVPCGSATAKVESSSGVTLSPVSQESSVTDVLGKVESGEADAGVVYATDVTGAGDKVESVPFPEAEGAVNTYPIAPIVDGPNAKGARAFIDYVTGADGRAVLKAAGFGAP
ncbi:molybdate ABC transporter substrate-binding protein [Leifsonia sp. F6_8S_P_1B]|uniref:Molybdate ABC transporter substrate-binding protein n=1 Tax=Leifsonia williamsii TaxID=3035919 RepID=A0ABT8KDC5_9MICO|nr:molybdate ABC transporter substrate-binding protein [Leifsonia williamsii]MDN4614776.1 molybdate ABC transporter substrate-binding protein [Leifsonia williamsii]